MPGTLILFPILHFFVALFLGVIGPCDLHHERGRVAVLGLDKGGFHLQRVTPQRQAHRGKCQVLIRAEVVV